MERESLSLTWKKELQDKRFRIFFIASFFFLAIILFLLTHFLTFAETREGFIFSDPIHEWFNAVDLTWIIFAVIYLSLAAAVISLLPHPKELLFAMQLYAFMVTVRMGAMYLLPLEPPADMIILRDPLVEFFGTGQTLTKDLFFSGHTASILIFYLTSKSALLKKLFLILLILIAILVILQKVHYTIDVYAAFFFTLSCFYILKGLKNRFNI
jgi:hypothetical protein